MGLHRLEHLQPLDHAVVELDQFLVAQAVDISIRPGNYKAFPTC
jgi:hypothetical protein